MPVYDAYVICTSPRSGSTLLCKLLSATGVAGRPGSHFHEPSLDAWLDYYGLESGPCEMENLKAVFDAARAKGRGGTDVFGLRLQRHSFDFFQQELALLHPEAQSDRGRMEAAFGRVLFVHLTRADKLEQAISFVKAQQTGLWHKAPDGRELERLSAPREPVYDGPAIKAEHDRYEAFDRDWIEWFAAQGVDPLTITYDTLSEDPLRVLAEVLTKLGLDGDLAKDVELPVAKLADETNRDWAEHFRQEYATG
ncbi:Stf0 family sulfotransferase [Roseibium polysiphoniae]|uniref:Sulfotransferase n=1 Tax=Roseibium polysiphoniae TaxID=2571221 RepID=A0ABR9CDP1_9HYPH|nr:Stf0 family sulfotransferase [Roseibium polysiphoniae]MBD8877967.1 sulfotransferase [Roseibium polysiphoniae]